MICYKLVTFTTQTPESISQFSQSSEMQTRIIQVRGL